MRRRSEVRPLSGTKMRCEQATLPCRRATERANKRRAHESLCVRRQRRRNHRRRKTFAERHAGAGQGPCLRPQPRRPRHDQGPCAWRGRRRRHGARHGMGRRSRRAWARCQGRQGRRQDHGLGRRGVRRVHAGRPWPPVPRALEHELRGSRHPPRRARHHAQRGRHQRRAAERPDGPDPGRQFRRRLDGDADRKIQGRQARDRLVHGRDAPRPAEGIRRRSRDRTPAIPAGSTRC